MKRSKALFILAVLLLVACGAQPSPEPIVEQPTEAAPPPTVEEATITPMPPTAEPAEDTPPPAVEEPTEALPPTEAVPAVAVEFEGLPLPTDRGDLFSASGACAACHSQMADKAGNDVSTDTFWRTSMMANAARDPYWQASVRGEVLNHPELQAVIEDKCAACHMPMASFTMASSGSSGIVLDDGLVNTEHELHPLAIDGVSCTLCHQIQEAGLGEPDSFSAGYPIDADLPTGERETFGPHPVAKGLAQIMQAGSGFIPLESMHVEDPALCATCHTLYTPYTDAEGQVAGVFPEQMAYFEWQASSFDGTITCQGCHMPAADGGVQLSITGGPPRDPFHQHIFVGGNAYMLEIIKTFGPDMDVTASSTQLQDKQDQIMEQLQKRTASIDLEEVTVDGSAMTADVVIASMVGHKFPTGFPSRRAWIHLTVQDAAGQIVFESGATNPDGSITGNDNDADAGTYEPHYQVINAPDQVQIYEAIMGDTEGQVTTILLKGAGYLKDNRLPPSGFDKTLVQEEIAVHGAALDDEDFAGGVDQIQYSIDLGDAEGPFTVTAELLFQPIGFRWADNLRAYNAPEPARFLDYYAQVPNQPVVIDTVTTEVQP